MVIMVRRLTAAATALAVGAAFFAAAPLPALATGTTWFFPSNDCPLAQDHGLQDCIDKTASGDTVVITADALASNNAAIAHSLTLRAQQGLDPTLGGLTVQDAGNTSPISVSVAGLTFSDVFIEFDAVDGSAVSLRNVNAIEPAGFVSQAVTFYVSKSATFRYIHGNVRNGADEGNAVGLTSLNSATVNAWAVGLHIRDVATNGAQSGISVVSEETSTLRAHLLNNDISGFGLCNCGSASGLALDAADTSHLTADIVGNTIDRSHSGTNGGATDGIYVDKELATGGALSFAAFDNILSRNTGVGIDLAGVSQGETFSLGYNDFWHNGGGDAFGTTSLGSHNLHVDPMYVDQTHADLRLRAGSPVIDAGEVCSPGGVANPDAAGNARLHGSSVDLGAYERGSSAPTGVVRLGTDAANTLDGTAGADILCGYGGADHLNGVAGADYLDGGKAGDVLVGGSGPDQMFGSSGDDRLCAKDGSGNDLVNGGKGTDVARTDAGDQKVSIEGKTTAC